MRKARYFPSLLMIILSALTFVGCANSRQNATSANANSSGRTHSDSDLQKTGKRTSGDALQAADPAVTARGGN
jgi:PBP1b-binding outer membrane lipoprotein LpoB